MDLLTSSSPVEIRSPAKLNLYLEVFGRREDGFHELETLMTAVSIYDSLYFQPLPHGELRLECRWAYGLAARSQRTDMTDTGATDAGALPSETENIVYRAVDRLRQAAKRDTGPACVGAAMTLVKRIPAAAGVGGASSDAAAALLAANESWQLGWSMDRLAEFSATIGSDVPFFFTSGVRGPGTAICRGRGERVEPVHGFPRQSYVIVRPHQGLSTADVYRAHRPPSEPESIEPLLAAAQSRNPSRTAALLTNRLEEAAGRVSPTVDELHQEFQRCHLRGHQMSGSGSSRFGVCRHDRHARRMAALLRGRRLGTVYRAATAPHHLT